MPGQDDVLSIHLLGDFRVFVGERSISADQFKLVKSRSLIKLLALAPNHKLHREQLMELFWPEHDPRSASNNLHQVVYAARRVLASPGSDSNRFIRFENDILCLRPDGPLWIDVEAFDTAAAQAHSLKQPDAYRAALALYTGDLLPEDRYEDWAISRREALRHEVLLLWLELARLNESNHEHPAVIDALQHALAIDPACEEAHVGLMRSFACTDQRQKALRQYQALQEILQQEFDLAPDAQTAQLYQEIQAGSFPPPGELAALPSAAPVFSTRRHNLPAQLTSFIGRQKELEDLTTLISSARLITILGLGGSGKTRLALQHAAEHIKDYPDGVSLVDLSAIENPSLLPQTIAAAWDLREQAGYPLVEALIDFLRQKRLLLILDTCEHLREACAQLGRDLLQAAPQLHLLATSREPLDIPGEVLYRLAPLDTPDLQHLPQLDLLTANDSVRLFIDRAQLVRQAFRLTEANAAAVAQICARLDGIPLAIELAAARVRAFTPEQINARLEDRFRLLTGGSPTSLPRQQTLQATIDWSHDLLSESEKLLFRRLSVFNGGWTFEICEAVCPGDGLEVSDLLDLLPRLVDRSLVIGDELPSGMRYRLLDTIRAYSRSKLVEAGEENSFRIHHLEAYLRLAEDTTPWLEDSRQLAGLQLLEREHDNLRLALEFALVHAPDKALRLVYALYVFWFMHGHFIEGRRWAERALQAVENTSVPDVLRSHGINALTVFQISQGEAGPALQLALEGLMLARRAGDRRAELLHLHFIGGAQSSLGEFETARRTLEQGIDLARTAQDSKLLSWLLNDLGGVYSALDELDQAEKCHQEAVAVVRQLGARWELGYLLVNLATAAAWKGWYEQAEELVKESIALLAQFGDRHGYSGCIFHLARFAWRRGDSVQARSLFFEGLEIERQLGRQRYIPSALERTAEFLDQNDNPYLAAILLGCARAYRRLENCPPEAEELPRLQVIIERVRSSLGEAAYAATFAEGERLSVEQAVERVFVETGK